MGIFLKSYMPGRTKSTKLLNILFLAGDGYPPFRVDLVVLFGKELIGRGHHIDWILTSKEKSTRSYCKIWNKGRVWVGANHGSQTFFQKLCSRCLGLFNDCRALYIVKGESYDLIQVKDKFFGALPSIFAARLKGIPFVFWLSFPYPEEAFYLAHSACGWKKGTLLIKGFTLNLILYRIIIPMADRTFVQSDQMKKNIMSLGFSGKRLIPVPMGISMKDLPEGKGTAALDSMTKTKRVVYIGTLSRMRKIDFLIRVFARVIEKQPESYLYLVGSGNSLEDENQLRREARRLGIDNRVIMTGFLPMKDAWQYAMKADVCVSPFFPSPILDVATPTKLIEYMALGKAVVVNDHPDQSKVISESKGGLCVPYTESDFSDAVVKLLSDQQLAERMGKQGRDYVRENREYSKIADMVEIEYQKLSSCTR